MMLSLLYMGLFLTINNGYCLCGFQNVSAVTFVKFRGKFLLRRIPYPSNGSFNPYVILNKEAHIVNGNVLNGGDTAKRMEGKYI